LNLFIRYTLRKKHELFFLEKTILGNLVVLSHHKKKSEKFWLCCGHFARGEYARRERRERRKANCSSEAQQHQVWYVNGVVEHGSRFMPQGTTFTCFSLFSIILFFFLYGFSLF